MFASSILCLQLVGSLPLKFLQPQNLPFLLARNTISAWHFSQVGIRVLQRLFKHTLKPVKRWRVMGLAQFAQGFSLCVQRGKCEQA